MKEGKGLCPLSARTTIVKRNRTVVDFWLRRPGGSAPWPQDGVPPPSLALRGVSRLYSLGSTGIWSSGLLSIPVSEQIKWGLGPTAPAGPGQRPGLPSSPVRSP